MLCPFHRLWPHLCRKEMALIQQNNILQIIRFSLHSLHANLFLLPTMYATTFLAIPVRPETLYLCVVGFIIVKNFAIWQLSINITFGAQTLVSVSRLQVRL